jgi:hypothetical protein
MALAVTTLQQNSQIFSALEQKLPGAAFLGVMDFSNTFMGLLRGGTPIGWKWINVGLNKKGKRAEAVGKLGKKSVSDLRSAGMLKAGTGKWKPSGAARTAWSMNTDQAGRGITFSNPLPYLIVLERGGYPNPPKGPMRSGVPWDKGWRVEGGFSKQAQSGIVKPLLDDDKLWEQALSLINKRISEMLSGLPGS